MIFFLMVRTFGLHEFELRQKTPLGVKMENTASFAKHRKLSSCGGYMRC